MRISRRNFIQSLGAFSALTITAGSLPGIFGQKSEPEILFPIPVEVYTDPLFSMGAKQFEDFLGRPFVLTSETGVNFEVVLTEVNPREGLENSIRGYYGECFSLIFEADQAQAPLVQDTYEVRAKGINTFSALIVPTGRRLRQYEIVINRLTR